MEYRPFVVSEAKNRWARRCKIELAGGYGHARGLSVNFIRNGEWRSSTNQGFLKKCPQVLAFAAGDGYC
jgi:hypothetical protein